MRLVAGKALTHFTVSAPHNERFAEFFTGEARDEAMDYHFANGKGPAEDSFCRRIFRRDVARREVSPERALPAAAVTYVGASDTVTKTYLLSRLEAYRPPALRHLPAIRCKHRPWR